MWTPVRLRNAESNSVSTWRLLPRSPTQSDIKEHSLFDGESFYALGPIQVQGRFGAPTLSCGSAFAA